MKWCMSKPGKFQFAGDNGVVDTIQVEADEKTSSRIENLPNRACVKFWLYSQASVPRQL